MIHNGQIRDRAKGSLERSIFASVWLILVVMGVIYVVIVSLPSTIGDLVSNKRLELIASVGVICFVLSVLINGPMEYGLSRVYVSLVSNGKRPDIRDLFVGYKEAATESVVLGLLRTVYIVLWGLLLVIPGIIKLYAYSMAFYIQQDEEDKHWNACLEKSQEMMRGHKWRLFLLDLSFLGWYIVGALCAGVGLLWVAVYHATARAIFYEDLKGSGQDAPEQEASQEEEKE